MNRLTRLTALLLALMMIFSTFAAAETSYQVGDMTTEQWNAIVQNAQDILNEPVIDEGDSGKVIAPPTETPTPSAPYDKTIEVPLGQNKDITTANLAVVKSDVAGQWQIAIKDDLWVNILGETGITLNVNAGMLQGTAMKVRQAADADKVTVFTVTEATAVQTFAVENRADSTGTTTGAASDVMTVEEANPDIEQWTVEIRYVFADSQNTAANSWTGKVAKNAALYTSAIVLPRVMGYYASTVTTTSVDAGSYKFVGQKNSNNNFEDGTIQLEINSVTADLVLYVNYSPAPMDFKVTHVYQDVNGEFPEIPKDGSTVDGITVETKSGMVTGTAVGAVAKKTDGFTNLWYDETVKIAADGSTNIIVYYERDWYLMLFDCNGGYSTEPVYARYGAQLDHKEPERPGYSFEGWKLIESNGNAVTDAATIAHSALPSTMPAENLTYQAQWAEGDTTYTVVYWFADLKDGTNPTTYSDAGRKTVTATSGTVLTPSVVGTENPATGVAAITDAPYFTYDAAATTANNDATVTVVGDGATVVNVYYSRNEYTIRFIYARKSSQSNSYNFANSTGCGTYNNENHDENAAASQGGHADIYWYHSNSTLPTLSSAYGDDQRGSFTETRIEWVWTGRRYEQVEVGYTYYYFTLTAEYGANLESSWPATALGEVGTYDFGSWAAQCGSPYRELYGAEHSNIVGVYPTMSKLLIMDPYNSLAQTMVAWWGSSSDKVEPHTYHNYFEVLPGESYDIELDGKRYRLSAPETFTCAHNTDTRVDPYEYEGFVCINDTRVYGIGSELDYQKNSSNYAKGKEQYKCPINQCDYCNVFYYTRNTYTLSFVNYNAESKAPADVTLMFGQSISSAKPLANPEYPVGLEVGGYKFVAWYTTPECQDGTEVDWNSTMPAGPMTVYAKWVPTEHKLTFYTDEADYTAKTPIYEGPFELTHNDIFDEKVTGADLEAIKNPTNSKNTNLAFIGWFYVENGEEKAWTPQMAVKKDLDLYGKWGLTEPVAFTVYFKLKDGTDVADPIVGKTLVDADSGTQNIDLEAKTGYDLFTQYQTGVFPITTSHTLVVDVKNTNNTYTFEYVEKTAVPYLVCYLIEDANGSIEIAGKKYRELVDSKVVADNRNAVVTEPYKMVPGYMPDAYQKRLIVTGAESNAWITVDGVNIHPENVINFIYHVDTENAFYAVEHYIQPVGGSDDRTTWTQVGVADSATGEIGLDVTATPRTIPGFTYHDVISESYYKDAGTATVTGNALTTKLTDGGVLFKLYYTRNQYPYVVRYLEVDTNNVVKDPESDKAYYQSTVTKDSPNLITKDNVEYELVSSATQSIVIQAEEIATLNVITFTYEQRVPITYIAMTKDANGTIAKNNIGGNVDLNDGDSNLQAETSELVRIKTGAALGVTAVKNTNYKFVGWYDNAACSGNALSTNESYIPEKSDGTNVKATYYALFELDVAPLTIRKTVTGINKPTGDIFVIQIELKDATGKALSGSYPYGPATGKTGPSGTLTLTNGVSTIGNIKDGDEIIIQDVVIGTTFIVTEVSKPGYYMESVTNGTGSITNVAGAVVEIQNAYQAGNLVITKFVDPAAGAPDDTFTMNVELTLPETSGATLTLPTSYTVGGNTYGLDDGVVKLKNGQSATIAGLPNGTKYTVTEDNMTYYTGAVNPSGEQEIKNANQEVTVTNTYNTGTLAITKTVVGDAPADEFAITVVLTLPNGLKALPDSVKQEVSTGVTTGNVSVENGVVTQKFTGVQHNGKITIYGLPVGTKYAVEESGKPAYYKTTGEVATPAEITAGENTVTITNEYQSGNLQIKKAVTSNPAGVTLPTGDKFTIVVTLTAPVGSKVDWNSDVTYAIEGGATGAGYAVNGNVITFTGILKDSVINITGLPAGTTYTITEAETYPSYYTQAGEVTTPVEIVASTTAEETITNTYQTCNLVVEKEVRSANEGTSAPDDEFGLKVTFGLPTDNGATAQLPTTYTKTDKSGNNSTVAFTATNGVVTISGVKAGDKFTFNNLPAGTTYMFEESTYPSYYTKAGEVTTPITIAAGETATEKIINTYYAGSLTVKKNVTSNPAVETLPRDTFTIDVELTLPADNNAKVDLSYIADSINLDDSKDATVAPTDKGFRITGAVDGTQIVFDGLPHGTKYTVTEINAPGYYEVTYDGSTTDTIDAPEKTTVAITNTYLTGSLEITKDVVGEGMPSGETFTVNVNLTLPNGSSGTALPLSLITAANIGIEGSGEREPTTGGFKFTGIADNSKITINGIPYGTTYSVTEETPAAYYTVGYTYFDSTEKKIGNETADKVTVTNTYNTGSLDVTKEVVGVTAPRGEDGKGTQKFSFTLKLTLNSQPVKATIKLNDSEVQVNDDGEYTFPLKDGETAHFTQLPANMQYTVTETVHPDYTTTQTGDTGVIVADTATETHTAVAKFINAYKYGDLAVTKHVNNAGDQSFIFSVNGPGYNGYIVIKGAGTVTLADLEPGEYTVTEQTNWSYRFNADKPSDTVTVVAGQTASVSFTNTEKTDKWLHDESVEHNVFGTTITTTEGGEQ